MNWLYEIKQILGKFWSWLFEDVDFVLGVQNLHALAGKELEQKLNNSLLSNDIEALGTTRSCLPKPILMDLSKIHRSYNTIDDVLAEDSTKALGVETEKDEWVVELTLPVDNPYMLTDHVAQNNTALFVGIDFEAKDKELLFRINPHNLGLSRIKAISNGELVFYYVIWAWYKEDHAEKNAVNGLITAHTGNCAQEAWRVRHEGATLYNTKKLLSKVTKSVVSDNSGTVEDLWTEQEYRHMLVDGRVYSAPADWTVRKALGDVVQIGDILFGDLLFYTGSDTIPANKVPGIRVMTDVGGMVAPNSSTVMSGGILPLVGNAVTSGAYVAEATRRLGLPAVYPSIDLPTSSTNVLQYVMNTVRRGRGYITVLPSDTTGQVDPALTTLRENTCETAILSVVVQTEAEATSAFDPLELTPTVTVGNAAIATCVTPLVAENSVTTEVWR